MEILVTLLVFALMISGVSLLFISDAIFLKLLPSPGRAKLLERRKNSFEELKGALMNRNFSDQDRQSIVFAVEENRNRCWRVSKVKTFRSMIEPSSVPFPDREKIDDARVFEHIQKYRDAREHVEIAAKYRCSPSIDFNAFSAEDQRELEEFYWNQLYQFVVKTIDSYYMSIEAKESSARFARETSQARRDLRTDPYAEDFKQLGI